MRYILARPVVTAQEPPKAQAGVYSAALDKPPARSNSAVSTECLKTLVCITCWRTPHATREGADAKCGGGFVTRTPISHAG